MARRIYISQDKHLADRVRFLMKEHGLKAILDGNTHMRLVNKQGYVVGTVPCTGARGKGTRTATNTLVALRRVLKERV